MQIYTLFYIYKKKSVFLQSQRLGKSSFSPTFAYGKRAVLVLSVSRFPFLSSHSLLPKAPSLFLDSFYELYNSFFELCNPFFEPYNPYYESKVETALSQKRQLRRVTGGYDTRAMVYIP